MRRSTSPKRLTRTITVTVIVALILNGCATTNLQSQNGQSSIDDPCGNKNAQIVGTLAGALLGALIGNKVSGGNDKTLGTLLGVGIGGALGAFIGSEVDKRQCELSKIQKKHGLDMQITPIAIDVAAQNANTESTNASPKLDGDTSTPYAESTTAQKVGLSVSVVDQEGKAQFMSDSDRLQPEAKEQFSEIACQYASDKVVAGMGAKSIDERKKLSDELRKKRVLLIGHTDDIGNSRLNADLSERRAKAVAQVFKSMGVGEDQLFYQGAGETLPCADNATAEGRAKNRRVEIVDLSNEETFSLYLQNRRANSAYYRPALSTDNTIKMAESVEIHAKNTTKPVSEKKSNMQQKVTAKKPVSSPAKQKQGFIDFGGSPFTPANATVDLGEIAKPKKRFMLISEAHADDISSISSCNLDRPRNRGAVKSLKDGKDYVTSEYLPGLYGRSWQDTVGGNLVVLNGVAVLRDGATPAKVPELKVYTNYNPSKNRNQKPDMVMTPAVNTYQGSNGLLYRVFTQGKNGLQCIDFLMTVDGSAVAKDGKLIYGSKDEEFVSEFKPKMIR